MMKENNQEMLQQYCDNNDQTNMALVIMVYQNTAPKMMCCSTNMDNKGHRGDHTWLHNIDFEKVSNQDIFNSSWWEAHFFLAVIFKSNFFLKAYLKIKGKTN